MGILQSGHSFLLTTGKKFRGKLVVYLQGKRSVEAFFTEEVKAVLDDIGVAHWASADGAHEAFHQRANAGERISFDVPL